MEQKYFDLVLTQKRGQVAASKNVNFIVTALIVVVFIATLAGTFFGYLGTGRASGTCVFSGNETVNTTVCSGLVQGLGNSTAFPSVPTWLPSVLIIGVAIGLLYMLFKTLGLIK